MKIIIFELIWSILKRIIPRGSGELENYSKRMIWQMKLAGWFGGFKGIIMGDSNAENLNTPQSRKQFARGIGGLFLNIGIGGTRADTWAKFLRETETGRTVYRMILENLDKIPKTKIVWNIGGNNILQKKMDTVRDDLTVIFSLFPMSFNCLVPPIHLALMEQISGGVYTRRELLDGVDEVNSIIKEFWKDAYVDTYTPFLDSGTREAFFMVLQDIVHFSPICDEKMRIPLILAKIG